MLGKALKIKTFEELIDITEKLEKPRMPTFDVIRNFVQNLGLKNGAEHDLNSAIWYAVAHVKAKEDIKDKLKQAYNVALVYA